MIDFMGVGAQKCGTTWLYVNLSSHPQIKFPAAKEIHFWDAKRHQGVDWWINLFPDSSEGHKQGEITPAYATLDIEVVREIHSIVPQIRLFYSVRSPMERAWSAALMALKLSQMTIYEASDAWFLDHFRSQRSRQRGEYAATLEKWLTVFPEESLSLIFFDDIVEDPRKVLVDLAGHLGVSTTPFLQAKEEKIRQVVFEGLGHRIRPSLVGPLKEQYVREIEVFSRATGRDLNHWVEWKGHVSG